MCVSWVIYPEEAQTTSGWLEFTVFFLLDELTTTAIELSLFCHLSVAWQIGWIEFRIFLLEWLSTKAIWHSLLCYLPTARGGR